jgi:hypothetical protein
MQMQRSLFTILPGIVCLLLSVGTFAQSHLYIGPIAGVKYSLSTSRNLNVSPTRGTGAFDAQGGFVFGFEQDKFALESGLLFGTLATKYKYESPLIGENIKITNRINDLLSIRLMGYVVWGENKDARVQIGSSLGLNLNAQYSKSLKPAVVGQAIKETELGRFTLDYTDIPLGREETNYSVMSGLFVRWQLGPRFDLRTDLGFNLGLDPMNVRVLQSQLSYLDPEGINSWNGVGFSENFTYSKGDHFFLNVSVLYHQPREKKKRAGQ